jgi:putative ABC transport system permease protein
MAWLTRFLNVVRPARVQRDLERELAFHLTERAEELREGGMSEAAAERAARLQFGNFTTQVERTRDMDIHDWLESIVRNVRYALRGLAKTPAFTATVILTLALAIGANSAVFSAIYAVLLRPLPFPNGDQLVKLSQAHPKVPQPYLAPVRLEEWNRLNDSLQAITGYYSEDVSELSGELPEKLERVWVAPRFLQVMGVAPSLGRDFSPQEERFGGPNAVLISDRLWRRRFDANPNAIGKTLRIGATAWSIIGIMPASFRFPDRDADLWSASPVDAPFAQNRELTWFTAIGRLKAGVTLARARANLTSVQANLARQYAKTDAEIRPLIDPLKEATVGGTKKSLWILFGSVSLLLLIACTNIAALLLSRATGRRHEISVRFSLGASRAAVAAQLLTEVLILALAGAALGLLLATSASGVFRALAKDLPRIDEIGLNFRVVCYSLACAVGTTLICGLYPAIRGTRRGLAGSLAHAGRSQVSGRNPMQFVLVGVQVALAVTLLAGAGLLLRSFQELGRVSPGFEPEHVLTFHISTSWGETADPKAGRQLVLRILDGLNVLPGIEATAAGYNLPGVPGEYQIEVKTLEGRAETEPKMLAQGRWVTPGYFATMRIPLVAGEMCRDGGTVAAAMVNRSFANLYFSGSQAIGRHLVQPGTIYSGQGEVRGIVGDARETGLDREPPPTVYWCATGIAPGTFFLARTHGDPKSMAEVVRRKVHELEPRRSVYDLTPLGDRISDAYAENRLRTILLGFFAITAVSLACVGLYGTLSYLVNLRRREVALRLALGALRAQVVRQFLGLGMRVAALGCIVGLLFAAGFAKLLSGVLYGVSATDTVTVAGVVLIVLAVSMVASLMPAIRAARVEPMQALREE